MYGKSRQSSQTKLCDMKTVHIAEDLANAYVMCIKLRVGVPSLFDTGLSLMNFTSKVRLLHYSGTGIIILCLTGLYVVLKVWVVLVGNSSKINICTWSWTPFNEGTCDIFNCVLFLCFVRYIPALTLNVKDEQCGIFYLSYYIYTCKSIFLCVENSLCDIDFNNIAERKSMFW